ncbi:MAG: transcription antitermination factor NusB [bacterium]|nr:transcription antitermination factor NusB [bacterium]MDZ4347574.1 transcription antitermination factor NusB [Candidatus Binatia bacterium]
MTENEEPITAAGSVRGTRRKGRELALQALYQIEITGDISAGAVDSFLTHFEGAAKAKEFARRLVSGVISERSEIDCRIEECTENWKLTRLAKVDFLILRLATYELIYCPDIPHNVSLNEAIEIGKRFGTDDSAAFINGVLDQIAKVSAVKNQ